MTNSERNLTTAGVIFGLFLSSIEITVVGTAAPRIVRELGGLDSYSWIFTVYLLTSTLFMPLWGRASDHWGRKKLFLLAMTIFIIGSLLCGLAQSMTQLIIFRAIKGVGGGGLVPLGFTIIADIYDRAGRAKIQGYLSSAWGISSIIGPFIGGILADTLGWRWIFFINLLPGFLGIYFIQKYFTEKNLLSDRLEISFKSLLSSILFVLFFLLSLKLMQDYKITSGLAFLVLTVLFLVLFFYYEGNEKYPLIPKNLFEHRMFTIGCLTGFFSSFFVIGLASFSPLLFQMQYHYTATESGLFLVPFSVSWVIGGIFSTRMMLNYNFKKMLLAGFSLTFFGFCVFMMLFYQLSTLSILICMIVMGIGMAFNYPIVLISTQHDVPKNQVGFATASLTWFRNLGATVGTTLMGLTFTLFLKYKISHLPISDLSNPLFESLKSKPELFFKPEMIGKITESPQLQILLNHTLFWVFFVTFVATFISLILSFFFPRSLKQG